MLSLRTLILGGMIIATVCSPTNAQPKTSGSTSQMLGCEHRVLDGYFVQGATAWQVDVTTLELPTNGRLLVKALRANESDQHPVVAKMKNQPLSDGKDLLTVHTIVPTERCSWRFVVDAPGFRLDYEPSASCTSADHKQGSVAYDGKLLPSAAAGQPSTCGSPSTAPSANATPSPTMAPTSTSPTASTSAPCDQKMTLATARPPVPTTATPCVSKIQLATSAPTHPKAVPMPPTPVPTVPRRKSRCMA
ncbi:hypothetical protein P43SY_004429 [Pythium insidiosum]|uniref:Uncharacterized protein n=1 Tax=Pythium insidiosum TaxID=114742 RepID=A0AAD5M8E4_PYTIN|nr:hypothetical protein P43SY_004429 [Pythium insidiosum]